MAFQELITLVLAVPLVALVMALIFGQRFRDDVLAGRGEASVFGVVSVKGAVIVLLCGLLVGAILFIGRPAEPNGGPLTMRLNVHFDPDEVNPRHSEFKARAFIKTLNGDRPIPIVYELAEGALSVRLQLPDKETPFYVVFETPKGTWKTDDHNMEEAPTTARFVPK